MNTGSMPTLWIVHRDDRARAALVRLLGVSDAIVGRPDDAAFSEMPRADAVVLGLSGDWETELEFAHRHRARLDAARWVLVGAKDDTAAALAHFDQLAVEFLAFPPSADALRRAVRPAARPSPSLSQRARREVVASRFSRWLSDLELPELLRALDPRMSDVPLMVVGEPGTGRSTLIRYAHHFGAMSNGSLAHIPCAPELELREIETALGDSSRAHPGLPGISVWLEDPGQLPIRVQRELAAWIEAGPPPGVRAPTLRWLTSVDETGPPLDSALRRSLGTIRLRLPPLRERPDRVDAIVRDVVEAWSRRRREEARQIDAAAMSFLREYPWPGNVRELETALEQTLASTSRNPLRADDLLSDGVALAPVEASEIGTLLPDEETEIGTSPPDEETEELRAPVHGAGPWLPEDPPAAPTGESPSLAEPDAGILDDPDPLPRNDRDEEPDPGLRRLASALIHQVRNPLTTIRTFAELLPERFDDPDFRARFPKMMSEDVGRIHGLLGRLEQLATLDAPMREKVDVSNLLEDLLEARRDAFRARHLLVLKELDSARPTVLADPGQLRLAFEALLDKALATVPERGDVYIASRRHDGGASSQPAVRVLLRFHDPSLDGSDPGTLEHSIELLIAELVVRAQGGRLTLGSSDAEERVLVVDLPSA
jgi:DNA-binding NtrC family response regulator